MQKLTARFARINRALLLLSYMATVSDHVLRSSFKLYPNVPEGS